MTEQRDLEQTLAEINQGLAALRAGRYNAGEEGEQRPAAGAAGIRPAPERTPPAADNSKPAAEYSSYDITWVPGRSSVRRGSRRAGR
jgi:hypothetical protein